MNCIEFRQLLLEYPDAAVDEKMSAALESHARTCPRCSALMAAHRLLLTGLSHVAPVQAPPGFEERLFAAIKTAEGQRSRGYTFAFQVAALLILISGFAGMVLYALAWNIPAAVSGFFASFASGFGTNSVFTGNPAVIGNAKAWLMEYIGRSGAAFMSLFVPVAIPSTSLSVAPIYPIGALIMVIQLWWYMSFPQTGISIHAENNEVLHDRN